MAPSSTTTKKRKHVRRGHGWTRPKKSVRTWEWVDYHYIEEIVGEWPSPDGSRRFVVKWAGLDNNKQEWPLSVVREERFDRINPALKKWYLFKKTIGMWLGSIARLELTEAPTIQLTWMHTVRPPLPFKCSRL
jgi:hypothetical protein